MTVYEAMSVSPTPLIRDRVCHVCYARAIGGTLPHTLSQPILRYLGMPYSFEEWKGIVENLLRNTQLELNDSTATLSVAETLLTNLKFNSNGMNARSYIAIRPRIELIMELLLNMGIHPTIVTLDALLSIACTMGTNDDIEEALSKYSAYKMKYSQYTFNTLLNRYANDANTTAASTLLELMHTDDVRVDVTTLNTLVKLFIKVKNMEGAKKVTNQ